MRVETRDWNQRDPAGLAAALRAARPALGRDRSSGRDDDRAGQGWGRRRPRRARPPLRRRRGVAAASRCRGDRSGGACDSAGPARGARAQRRERPCGGDGPDHRPERTPALDQGQRISIDEVPVGSRRHLRSRWSRPVPVERGHGGRPGARRRRPARRRRLTTRGIGPARRRGPRGGGDRRGRRGLCDRRGAGDRGARLRHRDRSLRST